MRIALALALLFGARFAASALDYPLKDGDVAWQAWLGERILATGALPSALGPETFSAAGAPWVPQEWLLSLLVAATQPHGTFAMLAMAIAALAAAAIALVAARSQTLGASTLAIGATSLCAGIAMMQSFGVRAQVGGWFCLALFLALLEIDSAWALAAILVAVLWANVHASVLMAPLIAAVWTLGALLDSKRISDGDVLRGIVVTIGSALATCASPLGYHLPVYAIALVNSPIRQAIVEWRPTGLGDLAFAGGVLPLAIAALVLGLRGVRLPWRALLPFFAGFVASLAAVRYLPIAAILMAPATAVLLTPVLPDRWRIVTLLRDPFVAGTAGVATLCAAIFLGATARDAVAAPELPGNAIAMATTLPGTRHLYCEDFAWCSLALSQPSLRTFVDGRCDPFPPRVWNAYLDIEHTSNGWRYDLDYYGIDTVLARRDRPLAQALAQRPGWHLVWSDARYALLARHTSKPIQDYRSANS